MIGMSSLVARGIGEKNENIVFKTAESGLFIAVIVTVLMLAGVLPFAKNMLIAFGAKGDYLTHSYDYLMYMMPTGAMIFFTSVFYGILQGEGLMKHVMAATLISTLLNIVLDPIFIFVLNMDVKGAAIATDIAQLSSFIYLLLVFLRGKSLIKIEWKLSNVKLDIIKKILIIGIPQSLAQIIMSLSFVILNRIIIHIDKLALTAFSLCGRFDQAVLMPIFAIGSATITIVGQNSGRGNFERVEMAWKTIYKTAAVIVFFLALVLIFLSPFIYPLFSNVDKVVWYAVTQTRILELSFIFAVIGILARSVFQAIGYPMPAVIITLLRLILIAVPAVAILVFVFDLGIYGVWFGMMFGNGCSALISYFWVKKAIFKLKNGQLKTVGT